MVGGGYPQVTGLGIDMDMGMGTAGGKSHPKFREVPQGHGGRKGLEKG